MRRYKIVTDIFIARGDSLNRLGVAPTTKVVLPGFFKNKASVCRSACAGFFYTKNRLEKSSTKKGCVNFGMASQF